MSAKLFQCQFLGYGWTNQSIHYMVFCRQKIPNKDRSWSKSEKVYTRLYLNKLENIMRALSDALPTGHRAMANPTLQLHFGFGRATPPVSYSHNWPSGRMQNVFVQNWTKKLFFANKDPKTNFDAWMILQKPVLSFKCNDFFKNGQFEGDVIVCHLKSKELMTSLEGLLSILRKYPKCGFHRTTYEAVLIQTQAQHFRLR